MILGVQGIPINITIEYILSIGDIVVILLLLTLINVISKRFKVPMKDIVQELAGQASWIIPLLRYMNDVGDIAEIAVKILKRLIEEGVVDKDAVAKHLARIIALERVKKKKS